MAASTRKIVGDKLKGIRLEKSMTQVDVAKEANMSTNYYARIERGDTGTSMEIFEKIIKALKAKSKDVLPY
jgi:transcriptional regulator with XRE-family HTH domain